MRSLVLSCATAALLVSYGAAAHADDFLQKEGDLWRASKLPGVNIYGPDHKKVGDITDVLMNKDGKVTYVVIGVGGFLGIGEKDVAIPFEKVTFSQEPMPGAGTAMNAGAAMPGSEMPGTPSGGAATNAPAPGSVMPGTPAGGAVNAPAPNSVMPGTMTGGMANGAATAPSALAPNAPANLGAPAVATGPAGMAPAGPPAGGSMPMPVMAKSTAYPDHGMIDYTVEQLKAAPTFTFAK